MRPNPRFYHHAATVDDKLVHFIMDRETGRPVDVLRARTLARPRVDTLNGRLAVAEALWSRRDNDPKVALTPGQLAYEDYIRAHPTHLGSPRKPWSDVLPEVQNIWEHVVAHSKKGFT